MGERYVREVFDDELHLADSSDDDGSHRGLEYDDENRLKGHAKYYAVDEREVYEDLREKYESDVVGDDEYEYEFDAEAFQKKVEIAEVVVAFAIAASPFIKEWFVKTALPGIKGVLKNVKDAFVRKKGKSQEVEVVEATYQVTPENSLALANQIEKAERKYRKKMSSEEARQELITIVMVAMELSRRISNLADADIQEGNNALMLATGWRNVIDALTKEDLIEDINGILERGGDALNPIQRGQLQRMLGRELYLSERFEPISAIEIRRVLEHGDGDDLNDGLTHAVA